MATININQMVTVKLTAYGASKYSEYLDSFNKLRPNLKEGDILRTQLWDLMHIFGSHIYLGMQAPFVDCEIEIL